MRSNRAAWHRGLRWASCPMARILLRDIPRQQVLLDVMEYPVEGGFRGFQNVLRGWHHIEVRSGATRLRGEVVIDSDGGTTILEPQGDRLVLVDDPERAQLASSGAMDRALIDAARSSPAVWRAWFDATGMVRLPRPSGPPPITGAASRARNFLAAHADDNAALAGAQAAFAALIAGDPGAIEALQSLWNAFANAGSAVRERPAFFAHLGRALAATLTVAPSLAPVAQAVSLKQLAEDLVDDGGPEAAEPAALLRAAIG